MQTAALDRRRIVEASLAVADGEGMDRLTMRRLSVELGVTPMAIYRHVAGKDELLDLVVDESLLAVAPVDPSGEPLAELIRWAFDLYVLLVDHPALAREMAIRRLQGPVAEESGAAILDLLERAGLVYGEADELLIALFGFVLGSAVYRVSRDTEKTRRGARSLPERSRSPRAQVFRDRLVAVDFDESSFRSAVSVLVSGYLARGSDDSAG